MVLKANNLIEDKKVLGGESLAKADLFALGILEVLNISSRKRCKLEV